MKSKLSFLNASWVCILLIINVFSYSQENTTILPPGSGVQTNTTRSLIPTSSSGFPETFPETEILPPSRNREDLQSQTNAAPKKTSIFRAGFTLGAQYGQFDKLPYTDVFFSPYMSIGFFFLMYEIPLRFDWNGGFVTQMWTSDIALISKIEMDLYYSKTNHVFKNIQVSIYKADNLYQGHGRFFHDYNPNIHAPYEVHKSFRFNLDLSYIGFNYIIANIASPDLMAAEIYIRPFARIKNPKFQFYEDFKLYAVIGTDIDTFPSFSPLLYESGKNSNSPTFWMFETGLDFPVFKTKSDGFALDIYADYSQFFPSSANEFSIKTGSGIAGGLVFRINKHFPILFEVAQAVDYWQPRWINNFYDVDKVYLDDGVNLKNNKYQNIIPNLTYFTASFGVEYPDINLFFKTELYGDFQANDLWLHISLTLGNILIKQLSLSASWTLRNLTSISFEDIVDPKYSIIEANIKYHMMPNMYWGVLIKLNGRMGNTFNENDEPIIDTIPFMFLGIDFSFRF